MPIYPGVIAAAASAAPAPGATPVFAEAGAITQSATLAATHSIAYPTTVNAGDELICIGFARNGNADAALAMHANMVNAGFEHITGSPWTWSTGGRALLVARKPAVGDEGGSSIPGGIVGSGGATSDQFLGVCLRFTAADGFAADPVESITDPIGESSSTSRAMPTVTPTDVNRLAVAILAFIATGQTVASATGESGGDWIERVDVSATSNAQIQVQTSDQSSGDPISGGTTTSALSSNAFILGFALVPADV